MTQKKENNTALIAGILFAAAAFLTLFPIRSSFLMFIKIIALAVICFSLFTLRRDTVLCVGFALLALCGLSTASNIWSWCIILAYGIAAWICTAKLTPYLPQTQESAKKLWLLPAVLYGVYTIYLFIIILIHPIPFVSLFGSILFTAALLLTMKWVTSAPAPVEPADPALKKKATEGMLKTIVVIIAAALLLSIAIGSCSSGGGGTSTCTICGQKATHVFQGSGYCDTHYKDAIAWAMTHSKK